MKIEFNINEYIQVKLTPEGLKRLEQNHYDLHKKYKDLMGTTIELPRYEIPPYKSFLKTDKEGWTEFQMWVFMQEFGPHIHMGQRVNYFDNNIRIGRKESW